VVTKIFSPNPPKIGTKKAVKCAEFSHFFAGFLPVATV